MLSITEAVELRRAAERLGDVDLILRARAVEKAARAWDPTKHPQRLSEFLWHPDLHPRDRLGRWADAPASTPNIYDVTRLSPSLRTMQNRPGGKEQVAKWAADSQRHVTVRRPNGTYLFRGNVTKVDDHGFTYVGPRRWDGTPEMNQEHYAKFADAGFQIGASEELPDEPLSNYFTSAPVDTLRKARLAQGSGDLLDVRNPDSSYALGVRVVSTQGDHFLARDDSNHSYSFRYADVLVAPSDVAHNALLNPTGVAVNESLWRPHLHPRDRQGRWADAPGLPDRTPDPYSLGRLAPDARTMQDKPEGKRQVAKWAVEGRRHVVIRRPDGTYLFKGDVTKADDHGFSYTGPRRFDNTPEMNREHYVRFDAPGYQLGSDEELPHGPLSNYFTSTPGETERKVREVQGSADLLDVRNSDASYALGVRVTSAGKDRFKAEDGRGHSYTLRYADVLVAPSDVAHNVLLNPTGVTMHESLWRPDKHPRGRGGQFAHTGGLAAMSHPAGLIKRVETTVERKRGVYGREQTEHILRKLKPGESKRFPGSIVVTRGDGKFLRQYDVHGGGVGRGKRRIVGLKDAAVEVAERRNLASRGMKADPGVAHHGPENTYERDLGPKQANKKLARKVHERSHQEGEKVDRLNPVPIADVLPAKIPEAFAHTGGTLSATGKLSSTATSKFEHLTVGPEPTEHVARAAHHGVHAAHGAHEAIARVALKADPGTVHEHIAKAAPHVGHGRHRAALAHAARAASQVAADDTVHHAAKVTGHVIKSLLMARYEGARDRREAAQRSGDVDAFLAARAIEEATGRLLREARFEAVKHPRGRGGKFVDVLGKLDAAPVPRTPSSTLGVTPYHVRLDAEAPRKSYAAAMALHRDPKWRPLFDHFKADAKRLQTKDHVHLVSAQPNAGVWEGNYEPSYKLRVAGKDEDVLHYNADLGRLYNQDAVVGFRRDKSGRDLELHFTGVKNPDAFYRGLRDAMGADKAGASFDSNSVRVFISGDDTTLVPKLRDLAAKHDLRVRAYRGHGMYVEP